MVKVNVHLKSKVRVVTPGLRFTQKNMKICWVRLLGNGFGSELMPLMFLETPLLLLKGTKVWFITVLEST
ncbi:hypothetical protein Hanom_Chr02g00114261 [Helianthus anomalus]